MKRHGVVAAVLLACAVQPSPSDAQWWKEATPASRLDQRVPDPSGRSAARLKWDDGYIEVQAGATADRALALNRAHERALALDAARQLAYFKLAEVVEGVAIDGVTIVKNAMVADQTVRSTVQARIRGAVVVSESARDLPDGAVWAEVVMGLRLRGAGSVTESVVPWAASRPADPFSPDPAFRVNDRYTGLIVDASDAGFSPALAPRLVEEGSGKVLFGPHTVEPASLAQQGAVGYAAGMADAKASGRVGANPLIVRAVGSAGSRKGDLVVSVRDAERVLAADRDGAFLPKAAIVLVLGKDRRELAARPGKRHALLVGVDEYRRTGDGGLPRLKFAVRDARAVERVLATAGGFPSDAVTVLEDRSATRERVVEALRALRGRVREEDSVVIYFSGHGSVGNGDDSRPHYFLVPHDGHLADLARTALMDDLLEELIGQLAARQVVVILDTCYAGAGAGAIRVRGVTNPGVTTRPPARPLIEASAGRVLLSASKPDQVAFEDAQRAAGVFSSFLVEGLAGAADLDGDGAITVLELFQWVSPRVRDYARREFQAEQTPVLEVRGLSGEITLARRP
ncbi:MAG: caspase family protein [Candidatus Rokubacteria bacterium]|nr:caspase family protein [Candidatus Rokubacteria bacterium]